MHDIIIMIACKTFERDYHFHLFKIILIQNPHGWKKLAPLMKCIPKDLKSEKEDTPELKKGGELGNCRELVNIIIFG